MTLTLTAVGRDTLDNGESSSFRIHRHDAVIGRSPQADWVLPDARNHLSAFHCEIAYRDGCYVLSDRSTNGTFLNGSTTRMEGDRRILGGDRFRLGDYELAATLSDMAACLAHDEFVDPSVEPPQALDATGLLRLMVRGLIKMIESRARAKADLGLQSTVIELEGNNPLKFIRSPDRAMEALLEPKMSGFMPGARAVEDAFMDLEAHEIAMMAATQAALKRSVELFAPAAVRGRVEREGRLDRLVPALREAALWRIYEREYEGVVRGAGAAFTELFSREFRREYQRQVRDNRARRLNGGSEE